ncbi:MAG TPA: 2-hydroxychromene-2-carboxylate isomerase [Azospirillaceae bacterium]|nr:2-hydroxychromene-2-carboxylate isomerase [Azospirillaceae bacterium]
MPDPIEFYFDFSSPYAYLAAEQIEDIAARYGRTVVWRPVLLGVVFKITGMQPGPVIPMRGAYMLRDAPRFARLLGLPFRIPSTFPVASTVPSRAAYWVEAQDPGRSGPLCRALLRGYFVDDRDPTTPEALAKAADEVGLDGQALLAGTQDQAVKDRLRAETDGAIARGVFGSPFTFVDGEGFWGADRLSQVELWLQGKGR